MQNVENAMVCYSEEEFEARWGDEDECDIDDFDESGDNDLFLED